MLHTLGCSQGMHPAMVLESVALQRVIGSWVATPALLWIAATAGAAAAGVCAVQERSIQPACGRASTALPLPAGGHQAQRAAKHARACHQRHWLLWRSSRAGARQPLRKRLCCHGLSANAAAGVWRIRQQHSRAGQELCQPQPLVELHGLWLCCCRRKLRAAAAAGSPADLQPSCGRGCSNWHNWVRCFQHLRQQHGLLTAGSLWGRLWAAAATVSRAGVSAGQASCVVHSGAYTIVQGDGRLGCLEDAPG